jgi:hypothetical protein
MLQIEKFFFGCLLLWRIGTKQQRTKKTANGAGLLRDVSHKAFVAFKMLQVRVSRYTRECNFADVHKKSAAFSALFPRNSTVINKDYVQTCYAAFHPNRTINVESTDRNTFSSVSKVWLSLQ